MIKYTNWKTIAPKIQAGVLTDHIVTQLEGKAHKKPFYFHARKGIWQLKYGGKNPIVMPDNTYEGAYENPEDPYNTMPVNEAINIIVNTLQPVPRNKKGAK